MNVTSCAPVAQVGTGNGGDAGPEAAGGLDAALRTLAGLPFGAVILWVVGAGLALYGLFCFARARYALPRGDFDRIIRSANYNCFIGRDETVCLFVEGDCRPGRIQWDFEQLAARDGHVAHRSFGLRADRAFR